MGAAAAGSGCWGAGLPRLSRQRPRLLTELVVGQPDLALLGPGGAVLHAAEGRRVHAQQLQHACHGWVSERRRREGERERGERRRDQCASGQPPQPKIFGAGNKERRPADPQALAARSQRMQGLENAGCPQERGRTRRGEAKGRERERRLRSYQTRPIFQK